MEEKKNKSVLRVKDYPQSERPMERLFAAGPEALSEAELMAVLLKTGTTGENAVELSRRVLALSEDGTLSGLCSVTPNELMELKGIGQVKAAQITSLCELARRISLDKRKLKKISLRNLDQLGELLTDRKRWLKKEVFSVIMVDRKWNILKISDISVGCLEQSLVHPREVFREAVKCSSSAIVISHNHPSGDPSPSSEDIKTTARLYGAGRLMGIEVVDHIITGNDTYYSMYSAGDMKEIIDRWQEI